MINLSFNFDSHLKSKHFIEGSLFSLILIDKKSYQHPLQKEWPHFSTLLFIVEINSSPHTGHSFFSLSLCSSFSILESLFNLILLWLKFLEFLIELLSALFISLLIYLIEPNEIFISFSSVISFLSFIPNFSFLFIIFKSSILLFIFILLILLLLSPEFLLSTPIFFNWKY